MRKTAWMLTALALSSASAWAQDRFPGSYLMVVEPSTDRLVVKVNNKALTFYGDPQNASYKRIRRINIEPYMKTGQNRITVSYGKLGRAVGAVRVSYAREAGKYRTIWNYQFQKIFPPQNNASFSFVAEGPRGSGRASTGSATRQTVLRYNIDRTTVETWINGQYLGKHTGSGLRDISNYWKNGRQNTIRVRWSGRPNFAVSASYAHNKNAFKQFWRYALHNQGPKIGDKTFVVTAPPQ